MKELAKYIYLTIERPNQKDVMFLNKNKVSICTTFQLSIWKKVNNSCLLIKYQTKMSYLGYNIHCIKKKDATVLMHFFTKYYNTCNMQYKGCKFDFFSHLYMCVYLSISCTFKGDLKSHFDLH